MSRHIVAVTTSRADYGHLYWPLRYLAQKPDICVTLAVTAAHLSPEFGHTADQIAAIDGVTIVEVESLLSSDTDVGMAKTIAVTALGLTELLAQLRPDLLLLIADRYENLAPASVALTLRIPIAHIEGGDVSEGAIDDAVRNALTKLSHIHFTPTEAARQRVLAMGEEDWRVHRVGAPSLDLLTHQPLLDNGQLDAALGIAVAAPLVVALHPLTLARDTLVECEAVFAALARIDGQIVFCFPNADAGSRRLREQAQSFCARRENAALFINLEPRVYWSLLRVARALVGNSSSGIMETPSIGLPCVNIGERQRGRMRAENIIDVAAEADAIVAAVDRAMSPGFAKSVQGISNPYGDGRAGERIASVLSEVELDARLLAKRALEVEPLPGRPGEWFFVQRPQR